MPLHLFSSFCAKALKVAIINIKIERIIINNILFIVIMYFTFSWGKIPPEIIAHNLILTGRDFHAYFSHDTSYTA
jgi:hypothetical protein